MLNTVIQLSHHQANVDFAKLRAGGVVGVVHKASQGTGHEDSLYNEHRAKATAAGLLWGAYHLGDSSDPSEQVKQFLRCAKADEGTLLALEWSELGGDGGGGAGGELEEGKQEPIGGGGGGATMGLDGARRFVELVSESNEGIYPGLLSGSVVKAEVDLDPVLGKCWLWIMQYADHPSDIPVTWGPTGWTMWQYTNGEVGPEPHTAPGVGACFRSRFQGNESQLAHLWGARSETSLLAAQKLIQNGLVDGR